jgi:hypothetical protein
MTIYPRPRRTAKPCPLRAFRNSLTRSVSTLARASLNPFLCYILPATGEGVPLVQPGSAGILPASIPYLVRAGRMPALQRSKSGMGPSVGLRASKPIPYKDSNLRIRRHGPRFSPPLVAAHRPLATSISSISPAYELQPRMSLVSPTYAKTGGCSAAQKCRRADIFDFSPQFSHFACPERRPFGRTQGRHACATGRWPVSSPLSVSTRQYCAAIAPNLGKTEPRGIPARCGSPRCGYVPFADRCPDADD